MAKKSGGRYTEDYWIKRYEKISSEIIKIIYQCTMKEMVQTYKQTRWEIYSERAYESGNTSREKLRMEGPCLIDVKAIEVTTRDRKSEDKW